MQTATDPESYDLLTDVGCFLSQDAHDEHYNDWWVHQEHAADFEAYLRIIEVPYRRQVAPEDCACGVAPIHRCVAFLRACTNCAS